ncbi:hypothetical protein [Bradyrhizobium sp. Tv2a-2]|uniref:hypothetical protein n=1 Tax=Bradyrhizobium sp. Tv2a-2 TaxID=113395 RepID=UPI0018DE5BB1|nr:hypothetical protein [Bradyrhizobium sp. Tv2a-2]
MIVYRTSIKAAVPAVTTVVSDLVRRGHSYPSYRAYPTYNSYYGAYDYGYYRSACAPGPRVGAFATAPWTDAPSPLAARRDAVAARATRLDLRMD